MTFSLFISRSLFALIGAFGLGAAFRAFFRGLVLRLVATGCTSRRGFMVGGIKPGTLEDDLGGGDHLPQRFFAAFRAGLQRRIGKRLMLFELNTT